MAQGFSWQCPFCNHHATITQSNIYTGPNYFRVDNADGHRYFQIICIACPNKACRHFTVDLLMSELSSTSQEVGKLLKSWKLIPPARMKVFPDYVPKPIVDDYREACSIVELSPKAAATLARRCIQGMIRDFWKIKKPRLIEEIDALKNHVDQLTWQAIDAVRKVGNIGAHMEQDINVIIDVDPGEAEKLIGLIEVLVENWYVTRQNREERLRTVVAIGQAKTTPKEE